MRWMLLAVLTLFLTGCSMVDLAQQEEPEIVMRYFTSSPGGSEMIHIYSDHTFTRGNTTGRVTQEQMQEMRRILTSSGIFEKDNHPSCTACTDKNQKVSDDGSVEPLGTYLAACDPVSPSATGYYYIYYNDGSQEVERRPGICGQWIPPHEFSFTFLNKFRDIPENNAATATDDTP